MNEEDGNYVELRNKESTKENVRNLLFFFLLLNLFEKWLEYTVKFRKDQDPLDIPVHYFIFFIRKIKKIKKFEKNKLKFKQIKLSGSYIVKKKKKLK